MVLIVTYDLHNRDRDYPAIQKLLKTARSWAHPQGSVWFLDTERDPVWWRDRLKQRGDSNDEFFVCRLRAHWAAWAMDKDVSDWLKSASRTW